MPLPSLEFTDLVAPRRPADPRSAGEHFQIGPREQLFGERIDGIGLAAMLARRFDDQLPHAFRQSLRLTVTPNLAVATAAKCESASR